MYRQIIGKIAYTSDKEGRDGQERGRESFIMTLYPDGHRTLEAHSEIDDEPTVLRHVTLSLDPQRQVLDAFVRIAVNSRFVGSTWYKFTSKSALCEGWTVNEGRISQQFDLAAPLDGFGPHPIQGDALMCAAYPIENGPGTKTLNLMLSSTHHRGATGPTLIPVKHDLKFAGKERIKVRAGEFDALHFIFGQDGNWDADDPIKHPLYHMWCTADGNYITLKAQVTGYMQTSYELTSLEFSPSR